MERFKRWRRFVVLMRYWQMLMVCQRLIDDPTSKHSRLMTENLTLEEMEGVTDLERIARIFSRPLKELKKELAHLEKRLAE